VRVSGWGDLESLGISLFQNTPLERKRGGGDADAKCMEGRREGRGGMT
jgi:hypothetical protein